MMRNSSMMAQLVSDTAYLLVHGAWHGPWCWQKIAPLLERAGHSVLIPDLSANERARTPITLALWTQAVCRLVVAQSKPVILVGHSRAGVIISQVAERLPEKIKRLVYVSAFLLRNGESVLRVLRDDATSPLLRHVALSGDGREWLLDQRATRAIFYGRCSDDDFGFARSRLVPEPVKPMRTPVEVSEQAFGRVPRAYIECLDDAAIPLGLQRKMRGALPCDRVGHVDSDHAPFFSAPGELAARLLELT